MRVVIHAGTHKTATTSFQRLLQHQSFSLKSKGIYYPGSGWFGCNLLVRRILKGDYSLLEDEISSTFTSNCRTLLISHEDLETCLATSPEIAVRIEELFRIRGFTEIIWFFVLRKPSEYFRSLLFQQSRHGILLDSYAAFNEIANSGCLSSPAGYLWDFSFDNHNNLQKFSRITTGTVYVQGFRYFVRTYQGSSFFHNFIVSDFVLESKSFALYNLANRSPGFVSSFLIWNVTSRHYKQVRPGLNRDTTHGPVAVFLKLLKDSSRFKKFYVLLSLALYSLTPFGFMTTLSWFKSQFTISSVCRQLDKMFVDLSVLPMQTLEEYFASVTPSSIKR